VEECITTLHPAGKAGVSVEKWKYERVRSAILGVLAEAGQDGVRFMPSAKDPSPGLMDLVAPRLGEDWDGSVGWYVTAVKLDLEARNEIRRVPGVTPQRVRLAK
jgi:hypothetical protein